MARFDLTLIDPNSTVPPLIISRFAGDDGYKRDRFGDSVGRRNQAGRPVVEGPAYGHAYTWTLNLLLKEDEALMLQWFEKLQQSLGYVIFQDEIEYVSPMLAIDQKPIASGSEKAVGTAVTGFFRGPVWLVLPGDGDLKHVGINNAGIYGKAITVQLFEVPGQSI